jgi:hypothetical protein
LLLQQSRGQKTGLVQHHYFSACSRAEARKQGWFSTITFLLAAEQRPEKGIFVSMWQHHYWGESAWYSSIPEQRPENSAINGVTPLLEGKAMQQSRGQKTGFCINVSAPVLEGKGLGTYYTTAEKRPKN